MPKRRKNKAPRVAPSKALEQRFASQYRALVDVALERVLPKIMGRMRVIRGLAGIRQDSWAEAIEALMLEVEDIIHTVFQDDVVRAIAGQVGRDIAITTGMQTRDQVKFLTGIDIFREPSNSLDEVDGFVRENVRLIRSIRADLLSQVEGAVNRSVTGGGRVEELERELVDRFKVSKSRGNLIARDQVNKLNGRLTRARHESMGVTKYIWRTVGDGAVRSAHRNRENNEYSYSNPPSDGHPGQPIQCRCWAEPVIEDLL